MGIGRILVADADADTRCIYSTILQHAGFQVVEAESREAALEAVRRERPLLVVCGLKAPQADECELLCLRCNAETAGIPLLMVTTDMRDEARETAEQAGCARYFVKPLEPLVLLAAVRDVLGPARARVERPAAAPLPQAGTWRTPTRREALDR